MRPFSLLGDESIASILEIASGCPNGCFVEVGVYKGGSAWHLAKLAEKQGRAIHLYDTFTGIPYREDFDNHMVGDFADTSYEAVCDAIPYATIHKGTFPETFVPALVAFAHIDADQYRSVKAAIETIGPLMVQGGAMVFDDVPYLRGATKALEESGLPFTMTKAEKALVRF
jgi:hypothetical protein